MPGKKKIKEVAEEWYWRGDDGAWEAYSPADAHLLEERWQADGPGAVFSTTDFSWNDEHLTVYKVAFDTMTQTNITTGVTRQLRRGGAENNPSAKKKLKTHPAEWMWEGEDGWEAFSEKDAAILEAEYLSRGPKAVFRRYFTFNKKHKTPYRINFEAMEQTNLKSHTSRSLQRKDPHGNVVAAGSPKSSPKSSPQKGKGKAKGVAQAVPWEWFESETMKWHPYATEDAALLESALASGSKLFVTTNLTFNKGYGTQYMFDFVVMTQINNDSGTSRKMRRKGAEDDAADGGYASVVMSVMGGGDDDGDDSASAHGSTAGDLAPKFEPSLPAAVAKKQKALGAQSLRGKMPRDYGPAVSTDAHARACFDEMLEREAEFCGEWAVFYHSYSVAALLYEVQAAVACVLFRFKSEFASLPRLMHEPFEHIPDAGRMLDEFPKWPDQDHNPAFRKVGLCGVVGLLADDEEAPPRSCFLAGYSVGPLNGLLDALLEKCGVPKAKVKPLGKKVVALAAAHGLDCAAYGGKGCASGRSGHYLQIFMRREIVDEYTYAALPFGVPDKPRQPMGRYLEKNTQLCGQVRITANPEVFLQAACVRMFLYSADPAYHKQRKAFQAALVDVLRPVLGGTKQRVKAATGIFGGPPPEWWSSEGQEAASKMAPERYASAH